MVDAADLKSVGRKAVWVRVPPWAPKQYSTMYVPSYVPDPIEIEGNVAEERWAVTVEFIRRVVFLHFISLLLIGVVALSPVTEKDLPYCAVFLTVVLVLLSAIRNLAKGKHFEQVLSLVLAPVLILAMGLLLKALHAMGWPTWAMGTGPPVALAYVIFARRDLSFLGMFFFSLLW